jgi:hypothetical protein
MVRASINSAIVNHLDKGLALDYTQRTSTIQLLGKDVTVQDARTGAADQTLEELGVMAKLEGAATALEGIADIVSGDRRPIYDRVLAKGMIIIIEKPATPYETSNGYRTKADGKTMFFDIDYITRPDIANDIVRARINSAVVNSLDKELEYT